MIVTDNLQNLQGWMKHDWNYFQSKSNLYATGFYVIYFIIENGLIKIMFKNVYNNLPWVNQDIRKYFWAKMKVFALKFSSLKSKLGSNF